MVDFQCKQKYSFDDLQQLMSMLRRECPWDREQTHASIAQNLLEESCEAMEAIDLQDSDLLCEELGDVLLQVVFHAQMASETASFTMDDVITVLCQKLILRHPHVFGNTQANGVSDVLSNWEDIKRVKKGQATIADAMVGVAKTLPPSLRALKLKKLVSRGGLSVSSEILDERVAGVLAAEEQLSLACQDYIEAVRKAQD